MTSTPTSRVRHLLAVAGNPGLRRLQLSSAGFFAADWGQVVVVSLVAFAHGGTAAVGLVGVVRVVPAAVCVPLGAWVADRFPRHRVLAAAHACRAVLLAGIALAAVGDLWWLVLGFSALAEVCAVPVRPAQWAMLPVLARSAEELVAANSTLSALEGIAVVLGPVVATALYVGHGPGSALAACVLASAGSAAAAWRIRAETDPTAASRRERTEGAVLAGFRVLAGAPQPRLVVGLFGVQTLVRGLLNVLVVVASVDLLGLGEAGVGLLTAVFGAGSLVGGLLSVTLVRRRRLGVPFAGALAVWGLPLVLVGVWPEPAVAYAAMAVMGVGNALVDVTGYTLLQRQVDDTVLARVFGAAEVVALATIGLGSALAPALVRATSVEVALVVTGLVLPVAALLGVRALRRVDATAALPPELALLQGIAAFAVLPPTTLEKLSRRLEALEVAAGTVVVRQGEETHDFYVVRTGAVDVVRDGRRRATLEAGQYFGEVALLHGTVRTADAVAAADTTLLRLSRRAFLDVVVAAARSQASLDALIATYPGLDLASYRQRGEDRPDR